MSRATYVIRNGQAVLKSEAEPLNFHYVHSDHMDATWHPANGKHYDSKSEFRKATRAAGCTEVGNETLGARRPAPALDNRARGVDIKRSIEQLRSRG